MRRETHYNVQYLLFPKTYEPKVWLLKGRHPRKQMTIDHLNFVMLNLYKTDTTIDKHDAHFII